MRARSVAHVPDQHAVPAPDAARGGRRRRSSSATATRSASSGAGCAACRIAARSSTRRWRCSTSLGLGRDSGTRRPTRWPTAGSASSRSRSRSPRSRACCCSTSRRPASREGESDELFAVLDTLPADVAILLIEHDMSLVFRFAEAHHRAGRRRGARDRHARRDRGGPARARGLSRPGPALMADAAARRRRAARRLRRRDRRRRLLVRGGAGRRARAARSQRRRQDDAAGDADGPRARAAAAACVAGRDLARMRASERARAGIGWVPQEREVFPSLTVEENLTVTALPGPWSLDAGLRAVPAAGRATPQLRQPAVRRRAADARDGPRADAEPEAAAARRAARRTRAGHRRRAVRGDLGDGRRARGRR